MRFFDFVEQNHRIRPAPHLFGQLAAFIVADVTRRAAQHPRDVEMFRIFGHIEANQGRFIIEQKLG